MTENLLRRVYSSDPRVHRAALADVLSSGNPVQRLLDLLVEVARDDLSHPQTPESSDALDARLMQMMDDGASEQELIAALQQARPFQGEFRGQRMVVIDLQRALVGLGRPAWAQMMELARRSPEPYAAPVEDALDDFAGVAAVEDVLRALTHEEKRIRRRAGDLLSESEDGYVETAARALAARGTAGADALLEIYRQAADPLRNLVGIGLMHTGDPRALDLALEWLLAPDSKLRLSGLGGLNRMIDNLPAEDMPRVIEALVKRLRQGDENSFAPISDVIAKLGQQAVASMQGVLEDTTLDPDHPQARLYALDALWQINQNAPANVGTDFAGLLTRLVLELSNPQLAGYAARLLGQSQDVAAFAALFAALEAHHDTEVLMTVVYALGRRRDAAALPALQRLKRRLELQPPSFEMTELIDEIDGAVDNIRGFTLA